MEMEIKRLDHWGIVAGLMKDVQLSDLINEQIGTDSQEILTAGEVVMGLVINGLGFASRPLMLAPQFFENKAIDILIKKGIEPEHFNRHKIGRVLDEISKFGCEKLFNLIALSSCIHEKVNMDYGHADTTTFSLHGEYNSEEVDENGNPIEQKITINHGYSKDHRPDLKQVVLELVASHDGGIPFITKTLSGNASDTNILRERATVLIEEFAISGSRCLVADSKLYSEKTAESLKKINFITRVPATIKAEQEYICKALSQKNQWLPHDNGYKSQEFFTSCYGIENQRWIIYYSDQAHNRSKKTLDKEVKKEIMLIQKDLSSLKKKQFSCEEDAYKTLNAITKTWRFHLPINMQITPVKKYTERGRPTDDTVYVELYSISAEFVFNQHSFNVILDQRSCFVLATNVSLKKSNQVQILDAYKKQDYAEKGFAFLKKPEFFTASLNLEKPGRIEAILMIMVLSLLIYSLAQRRLRNALKQHNETIPNQLKKPTNTPTMRWIFQLFEGVNFVSIQIDHTQKAFIQGLNEIREKVAFLIGGNTLKIYQINYVDG